MSLEEFWAGLGEALQRTAPEDLGAWAVACGWQGQGSHRHAENPGGGMDVGPLTQLTENVAVNVVKFPIWAIRIWQND